MKTKLQSGVALVITLLMLSVITFMTVAFLAISRRDRAAVTVSMNDKDARAMADAALARAQAEIVVPMIRSKDVLSYGLMVSRNYIYTNGFSTASADYTNYYNVNYDLRQSGSWNSLDWAQNIANLLYDPRPPVFVKTNSISTAPLDFRFWVDLNENGRFETNGSQLAVFDDDNQNVQIDHTNALADLVGEPEWIGVLQHPDYPHSASNQFVGRYAYLVCPIGKTLDLNYIHNYAKRLSLTIPIDGFVPRDGFLRNQGVGSWELNLAGYLYQLNTNAWGGSFNYDTNTPPLASANSGFAFNDASSLLASRYNWSYLSLVSAGSYFGNSNPFTNNSIDYYSDGPLQLTTAGLSAPADDKIQKWSGSDNTNVFYQPGDLLSAANYLGGFTNRMFNVGSSNSTYNRYTFQRLLATLGTDSTPELKGKININYTNDPNSNLSQTNFANWSPIQFFTNTANRLFGVTNLNIPVFSTNAYVFGNVTNYGTYLYTPAVHRYLQLAANIYDATTNSEFPSVFRPLFMSCNGTNYICGYTNDTGLTFFRNNGWVNYNQYPLNGNSLTPGKTNYYNGNVYGVPVIIGAKKGLPNFNELTFANTITVTRKLEFLRPTPADKANQTNQMYYFCISNSVGVEFWNPYRTPYKWPVSIMFSNTMDNSITVDGRQVTINNSLPTQFKYTFGNIIPTNSMLGCPGAVDSDSAGSSFITSISSANVLPDCGYTEKTGGFDTNLVQSNTNFDRGFAFPVHNFIYNTTNQLFCAIIANNAHLIDFVSLATPGNPTNVLAAFSDAALHGKINNYWDASYATNLSSALPPSMGITNQIIASSTAVHNFISGTSDAADMTKYPLRIEADAPNPSACLTMIETYQANDPLVHYTLGDLTDPRVTAVSADVRDSGVVPLSYWMSNGGLGTGGGEGSIGGYNKQNYTPWDKVVNNNMIFNDPNVTRPDDWDFPMNKFPNIGWIGRVHRGTPWQTVYLKSENPNPDKKALDHAKWASVRASGGLYTYPTNDWSLVDDFTTAPNDNAARGLLSVNQTNLAAWSAVLSGVIALTNATTPAFIQPDDVTNFLYGYVMNGITNLGINSVRMSKNNQLFQGEGDILESPTLTVGSPFINDPIQYTNVTDEVVERIPQQILSLLKVGEPRFVIYSYGQSLKPKDLYLGSGANFNICTNYQVTGESLTRTVCHVEGPATSPKVVVDSFNVVPGD